MEPIGETTRWLDAFFDAFFTRRPVDSTFIGVHEHDDRLPDLSETGAGDTVAGMRELLDRLPKTESDDPSERLDVRLAAGFLRTQVWEHESRHFHGGNPSLYTGEAIFGVLSLFLTDFAPLAERVDRAIERLHAVPRFLETARRNVRGAPREWTGRAIRECDGALTFLAGGLDRLAATARPLAPALRTAALREAGDVAAAAFRRHREHLSGDLAASARHDVACGEEALSLYLREGHFVTDPLEDILERARAGLDEAGAALVRGAADLGYPTAAAALAALSDLYAAPDDLYARHERVWEAMRALAIEQGLVSWPDLPLRFVPRPEWVRAAAPALYFLTYRSPAAYERPAVHEVLVPPIDGSPSEAGRRDRARAMNDGVIKLNHVIHHAGIGHHVQNGHAFGSRSRVGRIAAVDCASRIAMFCGGTMAEGWACYATDLMREAGALTPLEELSELQTRARMCARAIVDIRLHTGGMTLDEAAGVYEREAGMPPAAARAEATKNSMFPGGAVMYMLGTDAIHGLRRDMRRARGAEFDLRDFHDELLSCGSVPVSLVAESMRAACRAPSSQPAANPPC